MRAFCRCSLPLRIAVDDSGHAPVRAVLDARRHALDTKVRCFRSLPPAESSVLERAPLGAGLAALRAEALLNTERAAVEGLRG